MTELYVEIGLIPKGDGKINSIALPSCNPIGCNSGNAIEVLSAPYIGDRPFLLGISKLDYGDIYCSQLYSYDGFISAVLASETGKISDDNEIVVHGEKLDHLVIMFDQKASQWATKLSVNDEIYENIGAQFVWQSKTVCENITIKILEWNTPGYPFRITGIFTGLTLRLDKHNIKECVRGSQCTANNTLPKFGVLPGYGNLTIYDIDCELQELSEMRIIKKGAIVKMFINDAPSRQISEYIIEKWNYDMVKKEIKIDLTERIQLLEQNEFPEFNVHNTVVSLTGFIENLAVIYKNLGFVLNTSLPKRLENMSYSYIKFPITDYRAVLEEICKLHGLYAMQNEKGEIVFIDL